MCRLWHRATELLVAALHFPSSADRCRLHVLVAQCHYHAASCPAASPVEPNALADALVHSEAALEHDAGDVPALLTHLHVRIAMRDNRAACALAQRLPSVPNITTAQLTGAHGAAAGLPDVAYTLSAALLKIESRGQACPSSSLHLVICFRCE